MVELRTRWRETSRDGANCNEKLGLTEFRVQVKWISAIRQVWLPIRRVIIPTRVLPIPIRQVVSLISHFHSYSPRCSHFHPTSLYFSSITVPLSQNRKWSHSSLSLHVMMISWHLVQHTPSTAYTEYNIHRVQHTSSTASIQDCLFVFPSFSLLRVDP